MRIITAESAGFCHGVQRAVSICEKAAREHGCCVTLGPLIHNDRVILDLEEKGVKAVSDISELAPGDTVIIRSHGACKEEVESLAELGVEMIDATCPDVKRIHDIVRDEYENGRIPVIIGDPRHAEVIAAASYCGKCLVFEAPDELTVWLSSDENAQKPLSFVFQTTNTKAVYNSFVEIIKKECTNHNLFDTICKATRKRQQEAAELSEIADVMVVVGGKNSANSLKLADICRESCRKVFFIEDAKELDGTDIRVSGTVGVTAGASTPEWIIKEVTRKMSEEVVLEETCAEQEPHESLPILDDKTVNDVPVTEEDLLDEQAAALLEQAAEDTGTTVCGEAYTETVSPETELTAVDETPAADDYQIADPVIPDEALAAADEPEPAAAYDAPRTTDAQEAEAENSDDAASSSAESFAEMLEKSIKTLHTGQKVTGIVTSITATEVSVDLGTKQSGYIPISEFTDDSNSRIEDIICVGDTVESFVMRVNDVEGMVMLSKKRLDAIRNWDEIEAAKDNKTTVEGVVTEENKGGIVVNVRGVRVFVPASQTGLPKSALMSELLKKTVKLRVTEVNQSRRRVVGSIRAASADERREMSDRLWDDIQVGKQYDGVVKSMTSYGVFVDIGGVDGMIHISELSWTRVKQPSEVMSVGDKVSVYVLSFDKDNRKISLGYKKSEDNPWAKFTTLYKPGDIVNVKIVKMMPFGAFAEICPGVDGLIHISQITDHRIGVPSEVLSDGQKIDVKITEIDLDRKKISLSIRALIDPSSQPVSDSEAAEAVEADNTPVVVYDTDAPPPPEPEAAADAEPAEEPEVAEEPVPEAEAADLPETDE